MNEKNELFPNIDIVKEAKKYNIRFKKYNLENIKENSIIKYYDKKIKLEEKIEDNSSNIIEKEIDNNNNNNNNKNFIDQKKNIILKLLELNIEENLKDSYKELEELISDLYISNDKNSIEAEKKGQILTYIKSNFIYDIKNGEFEDCFDIKMENEEFYIQKNPEFNKNKFKNLFKNLLNEKTIKLNFNQENIQKIDKIELDGKNYYKIGDFYIDNNQNIYNYIDKKFIESNQKYILFNPNIENNYSELNNTKFKFTDKEINSILNVFSSKDEKVIKKQMNEITLNNIKMVEIKIEQNGKNYVYLCQIKNINNENRLVIHDLSINTHSKLIEWKLNGDLSNYGFFTKNTEGTFDKNLYSYKKLNKNKVSCSNFDIENKKIEKSGLPDNIMFSFEEKKFYLRNVTSASNIGEVEDNSILRHLETFKLFLNIKIKISNELKNKLNLKEEEYSFNDLTHKIENNEILFEIMEEFLNFDIDEKNQKSISDKLFNTSMNKQNNLKLPYSLIFLFNILKEVENPSIILLNKNKKTTEIKNIKTLKIKNLEKTITIDMKNITNQNYIDLFSINHNKKENEIYLINENNQEYKINIDDYLNIEQKTLKNYVNTNKIDYTFQSNRFKEKKIDKNNKNDSIIYYKNIIHNLYSLYENIIDGVNINLNINDLDILFKEVKIDIAQKKTTLLMDETKNEEYRVEYRNLLKKENLSINQNTLNKILISHSNDNLKYFIENSEYLLTNIDNKKDKINYLKNIININQYLRDEGISKGNLSKKIIQIQDNFLLQLKLLKPEENLEITN